MEISDAMVEAAIDAWPNYWEEDYNVAEVARRVLEAAFAASQAPASVPVGYLKPKAEWAVPPYFVFAEDRVELWMEQIFTIPVFAAPVPQATEGWRDISTAPKSGRFLALAAGEIERIAWDDPAAVVTCRAPEGAIACYAIDGSEGFVDEFGEVYGTDGRVIDAEDLTAEDDVLRLIKWMPLPASPTPKAEGVQQ